jgi:hypothetical protein
MDQVVFAPGFFHAPQATRLPPPCPVACRNGQSLLDRNHSMPKLFIASESGIPHVAAGVASFYTRNFTVFE